MNEIIFNLLDQSGSLVPIRDGKKSISEWNKYQIQAPTEKQVTDWLNSGKYSGFGLMMGYGNFHSIDLDRKNLPDEIRGELYSKIWSDIPESLKTKLVVQQTPNSGEHLIYKCPVKAEKKHLVANPATKKPVVETIGSRNYILVDPSPGYSVVSGSLSEVQEISEAEHYWLLSHCRKVGDEMIQQNFPSPRDNGVGEWEPICRENELPIEKVDLVPLGSPEIEPGQSTTERFISDVASKLESTGVDITENYKDWIKAGYAIGNELGENGRRHFHRISRQYAGYVYSEADDTYTAVLDSIGTNDADKQATAATLNYLLKKQGVKMIESRKPDNKTARKTNTAIDYIQGLGLIRNTFTNKVEKKDRSQITDADVDNIYVNLRKEGLSISKGEVCSIINSGHIKRVDPLKEWLQEVESEANEELIDRLFPCFKLKTNDPAKTEFYYRLLYKWLLQIPAMILDRHLPRLVLVLIGDTYIGKTEFFRRLLPENLRKYYAESALDREKDSEILMSESLLINIDELAGIMKSARNVEKFKQLASAKDFCLRAPYGKINEHFLRKAILGGTSNKIDIIQDHDTGNSRIIPLELSNIDKERFNAINLNALFGALSKKYKELGTDFIQLTSDELEMLIGDSKDFTTFNAEQELIMRFFQKSNDQNGEFMTTTEIVECLSAHTTHLSISPRKISSEMRKLGFKKDRKRVDGSGAALNGFYVARVSSNRIKVDEHSFLHSD